MWHLCMVRLLEFSTLTIPSSLDVLFCITLSFLPMWAARGINISGLCSSYSGQVWSLLPPSHVFAVNGVFTVPRSDGILRFIMDARNTNELFLSPMDPNLPGPDCIAQLDLRPSDEVWAATSDISNFYDCFLLPEWMLPFMALPSGFLMLCFSHSRTIATCFLCTFLSLQAGCSPVRLICS
eukprot:g82468.t1